MPGQLSIPAEQIQEFKDAATTYRRELLTIPILGLEEDLPYMTLRLGIQGKEKVGTMTGDAQFAPYKARRKKDIDLKVRYRTLETFFGSVVAEFEPNSAASTILGSKITKGDSQASTPVAKDVLTLIAKSLSKNLHQAIWKGVRNEEGDTTLDLFDGLLTIIRNEKSNVAPDGNVGAIAARDAVKNEYLATQDDLKPENAVDFAKNILRAMSPQLRREKEIFLFCSQEFADNYNEAYLLSHGAAPYNDKYEQTVVEGSNGRLRIIPVDCLDINDGMIVTTKDNLLIGADTLSDVESIDIERFEAFVLSYIATIFFGVQFESIDRERFMFVNTTVG
ncbi:MAG: hypothetical protein HDS14_05960 [Bacteroides sp.]|nr:hypothetical protein [Bacteroides sp.]